MSASILPVYSWVFWIVVFALCLVIEACTMNLTTIWFALAALAAMFVSFPVDRFIVQAALFVAVSAFCLVLFRPYAVRRFNTGREKTNVEALPGKKALVISRIDNLEGSGRVYINGNEWMAKSEDGSVIEERETVTICQVSGVSLIVRRDDGQKNEK